MNFPSLTRTHNLNYVSFFPRVLAELIDGLIYSIWIPLLFWYLSGSSLATIIPDSITALALIMFPGVIFAWTKVLLIHHSGQTFGKMIVGLEVFNKKKETLTLKRAFFREIIGKAISAYVFGAGFFAVLFDPRHQAWHDHFVGSFVYDKKQSKALAGIVIILLLTGYGMVFKMSMKKFEQKFLLEIRQMALQNRLKNPGVPRNH